MTKNYQKSQFLPKNHFFGNFWSKVSKLRPYLKKKNNRKPLLDVCLKTIFSDSNNIILWHESEDINKQKQKQKHFPNFCWIQFKVFILLCMINLILCVSLLPQTTMLLSVKIALISYWNDFSLIPMGKCAFSRRAMKRCKKKNQIFRGGGPVKLDSMWQHRLTWLLHAQHTYYCIIFKQNPFNIISRGVQRWTSTDFQLK